MTVLHSVLPWRMDVGFVAEFESKVAISASAFQGGSLPVPCKWIPGLRGSPCLSVALRVQLRFRPDLAVSSELRKSYLWLNIARTTMQIMSNCVKHSHLCWSPVVKSGSQEPFWSWSCRETSWYLSIPWPFFLLYFQKLGISQRSTLLSVTLTFQYTYLVLHSGIPPHFSKSWRHFRYFHLRLIVVRSF